MSFLTEPEPERGVGKEVAPGIRRVVARNAGPMTYRGTNTYLVNAALTGAGAGVIVIDPGPDDAEHVADVLAAAGGAVSAILLSHTHHDHVGATAALRSATGAAVHGWHAPALATFVPEVALEDGGIALGWEALHTPGHASDHVCFAGPGGVVFSADHVMSWSSSVVGPPGGDMAEYFASLRRMLARRDTLYLPGHGPPLADPLPFVEDLLAHRLAREAEVLAALTGRAQTGEALTALIYSKVDPVLRRAAARNVMAHLGKLAREGLVRDVGEGWVRV